MSPNRRSRILGDERLTPRNSLLVAVVSVMVLLGLGELIRDRYESGGASGVRSMMIALAIGILVGSVGQIAVGKLRGRRDGAATAIRLALILTALGAALFAAFNSEPSPDSRDIFAGISGFGLSSLLVDWWQGPRGDLSASREGRHDEHADSGLKRGGLPLLVGLLGVGLVLIAVAIPRYGCAQGFFLVDPGGIVSPTLRNDSYVCAPTSPRFEDFEVRDPIQRQGLKAAIAGVGVIVGAIALVASRKRRAPSPADTGG
jgi:hypothetical protein